MHNTKLIFCFLANSQLGLTLEAFLIKILEDKSFSYDFQRVVHERLSDYDYAFSEQEIQTVRKISEILPSNIERLFNKKKVKKEVFFEKLAANEELSKAIASFCDRRIAEALKLLAGETVYWRDKVSEHPGMHPFVVEQDQLKSIFRFTRVPEGIQYVLEIERGDIKLNLKQSGSKVVCNQPGWLMHSGRISPLMDGTDGQKLLPFLTKDRIEVPDRLADNFLSAFLIKTTRRADVRFEGFEVVSEPAQRFAALSIAPDLDHNPVLHLTFHYDAFVVDETYQPEILAQVSRKNDETVILRFQRDADWEATRIKSIEKLGLNRIRPSWYHSSRETIGIKSPDVLVHWLAEHTEPLRKQGFAINSQWQNLEFLAAVPEVVTREMKREADWFDLFAVVRVAGMEIPFIKFKRHILGRNPRYTLPDGRIILLPESWFIRFADLFEFSEDSNDRIRLHRQHQGLLNGHPLLSGDLAPRLKDEHKKIYTGNIEQEFPVPQGLQATLRSYQKKGFDWLCTMAENKLGACLADDMGLGKTLQIIALLQRVKETRNVPEYSGTKPGLQLDLFEEFPSTSLIVMAPSLVHNWEKELHRFAPDLRVKKHSGYRRTSLVSDINDADVLLTTYGVVRNDLELLNQIDFNYVVLDESQLIKNMRSMSFQSVKKLNSLNRIVLTGTPVENSLTDLWSQLTFLQPGLLGSYSYFRQEFVLPIEQHNDEQKRERLQKIIRPFILRRTKEEVAPELPIQTRTINFSSMDAEQQRIYEEQKSYYRNKILENINKEGIQKSQILILRGLTHLRKLAIHPVLFDAEYRGDSAKFSDVLARLEELRQQGRKVLLFSQFVKHLQLFREAFEKENLPYSWLTGEVPQQTRGGVISEFEQTEGFRAFLIQLRTGGSGLNLTKADCVFLLDPWWNPAAEEQAIARSHRIGQHLPVFVWRFITKETIEEKIMKLQERKSQLASDMLSQSNPIARLSQEDLEELFS
jgi:superfamily II DNA or RNA helicase